MNHLSEDQFVAVATRGADAGHQQHLDACEHCRARAGGWQAIAEAAADADRMLTGDAVLPSFDVLLAGRLPAPAVASSIPAWSFGRAWRIGTRLMVSQVRMLPRSLGPITLAGLVVATVLTLTVPSGFADRLGAAVIALVVLLGTLGVASERSDPRGELLQALPVAPASVFLARLTLVLAADLVGSVAVSVLSGLLGGVPADRMITDWLGPSLLSAGLALVVSVWKAPWLGATAGVALWLAGTFATLPHAGHHPVGLGAFFTHVWTTGPWTITAGLLLLATAIRLVARAQTT